MINSDIIGLLPAAGQASRVAPLPTSKELFPVGFGPVLGKKRLRPKVAAHYLLDQMRLAGAGKAFFILRKGKWDIPAYFGDGYLQKMHLAYLIMRRPYGVPYTIDQAYPFIQSANIVFGFPDIIIYPKDVYAQLMHRLIHSGADIALGVFKCRRKSQKMDMVELDTEDRILRIDIKPQKSRLHHTWIAAAWTPVFTKFIHDFVRRDAKARNRSGEKDSQSFGELHMGDVIRAGLADNVRTTVARFDTGAFLDIGTPDDIISATNFVMAAENGSVANSSSENVNK